jgi:hypothetical protein
LLLDAANPVTSVRRPTVIVFVGVLAPGDPVAEGDDDPPLHPATAASAIALSADTEAIFLR